MGLPARRKRMNFYNVETKKRSADKTAAGYPTREARESLKAGDTVKVISMFEPEDALPSQRMDQIQITKRVTGGYVGKIVGGPDADTEVQLGPEHVVSFTIS